MIAKEQQLASIRDWTTSSIIDCCEGLENDKKLSSTRMKCGDLFLNNEEKVQIQIIVTRDEDDFLGDFDMVENVVVNK